MSENWIAKKYGSYGRTSPEAANNADMFRQVLTERGWSVNAIAGLLGNVENESGYNPWRWQSDDVLNSWDTATIRDSYYNAYGLFQFTPAGKYIYSSAAQAFPGYGPNFNDITGSLGDGTAQLLYIDAGYGGYYETAAYPLSLAQFKQSELAPSYLAEAWLFNYERPADPGATIDARREAANYWYEYFQGHPAPGFLPLWLMGGKIIRKRRRRL